jgi:hypothetical protein
MVDAETNEIRFILQSLRDLHLYSHRQHALDNCAG